MQISQEQYNKLPERLQKYFSRGNIHPTVKSVGLMSYLINMVTPKGGIVLDPFMGSGSTGVACKKNGFEFIGIEMETEYIKIAEKRILNYTTQSDLDL